MRRAVKVTKVHKLDDISSSNPGHCSFNLSLQNLWLIWKLRYCTPMQSQSEEVKSVSTAYMPGSPMTPTPDCPCTCSCRCLDSCRPVCLPFQQPSPRLSATVPPCLSTTTPPRSQTLDICSVILVPLTVSSPHTTISATPRPARSTRYHLTLLHRPGCRFRPTRRLDPVSEVTLQPGSELEPLLLSRGYQVQRRRLRSELLHPFPLFLLTYNKV
ncbi:uncharacterized protein LOC122883789 [Siniperca chuatsi]|uniref:uncharacterized protein LOC122883789 n=1 Tax=Siniperca chuatsi TaxID=119488 RepID=UPI001CE05B53|nr:uncharacterized protein LOC122883789 [Siniperca chuatsi]